MKTRHLLLPLLAALLLSGCELPDRGAAPAATPTEMAAAATPTPEPPTATPQPTPTEEPTPEPTATPAALGAIIGRVFHDVCIHTNPDDEGCQTAGSGARAGNGVLDDWDEPLAGVRVFLGAGICPATGLAETLTNADGFYAFAELLPGDYCVSVDPEANPEMPIAWQPGIFTLPLGGAASLRLEDGEARNEVNFGWDYEHYPVMVKDCTDILSVVDTPGAPDGFALNAGQEFTRIWRLENAGSCTWTTDYALVHADGDPMGETTLLPLEETVAPGQTIDLALPLTGPGEPGSHSGEWLLRNEHGQTFGSGLEAATPLTVRVSVLGELIMAATLGEPAFRDTLDSDERWNLFEDSHVQMAFEEGRIRLTSKQAIGYDSWTVTASTLGNATIEAVFTTGPACEGYDRYGLIVRSETINTGYFLGISCNGNYVVRQWNGRRWDLLAGWAPGKGINTGPDQVNHLVVVMSENTLSLYVNGELQVVVQDRAAPFYRGGRFGPFIAGQSTRNFTVFLEDIAYWATP